MATCTPAATMAIAPCYWGQPRHFGSSTSTAPFILSFNPTKNMDYFKRNKAPFDGWLLLGGRALWNLTTEQTGMVCSDSMSIFNLMRKNGTQLVGLEEVNVKSCISGEFVAKVHGWIAKNARNYDPGCRVMYFPICFRVIWAVCIISRNPGLDVARDIISLVHQERCILESIQNVGPLF